MRNRLLAFILVLPLLLALPAKGRDEPWSGLSPEPTFGPEFTFSNDDIWTLFRANRFDFKKIMEAMSRMLDFSEKQSKGEYGGEYSVGFGDPQAFVNFIIDQGVIEVNARPGTLSDYQRLALVYERLVFQSARQAGLHPMEKLGGGHVHIGTVFEKNPQLLRDFTVDFINHPALSMGTLGYNPKNATHLADMDPRHQLKFLKLIRAFDEDKSKGKMWSSPDFAREFTQQLQNTSSHAFRGGTPYVGKAFALNLLNLYNPARQSPLFNTAEVRAIAPQKNYGDFLKIITLFRSRLLYLTLHPDPTPKLVTGPRNFLEARNEFKTYVEECGLPWKDYQHFAVPSWAASPEKIQRQDPFALYQYTSEERAAFEQEYNQIQSQALLNKPTSLKSCLDVLLPN